MSEITETSLPTAMSTLQVTDNAENEEELLKRQVRWHEEQGRRLRQQVMDLKANTKNQRKLISELKLERNNAVQMISSYEDRVMRLMDKAERMRLHNPALKAEMEDIQPLIDLASLSEVAS